MITPISVCISLFFPMPRFANCEGNNAITKSWMRKVVLNVEKTRIQMMLVRVVITVGRLTTEKWESEKIRN